MEKDEKNAKGNIPNPRQQMFECMGLYGEVAEGKLPEAVARTMYSILVNPDSKISDVDRVKYLIELYKTFTPNFSVHHELEGNKNSPMVVVIGDVNSKETEV